MTRVVIIDDEVAMRAMLRRALAGHFEVVGEAVDGEEGAHLVASLQPDAVVVDLSMPKADGVEFLRMVRAAGSSVRALVLTSNNDRASITRAIEAGADGYVLKGSRAQEIRAALTSVCAGGSALTPAVARSVLEDYTRVLEDRRARDLAVITTLAGAVEARDAGTGDHAQMVTRLSVSLWQHLTGARPDDELQYGFLLHDVGKISIPDAVLLKPSSLTDDEMTVMKNHVDIGVAIVEPLGFPESVTDVIRCHHERYDGGGYPRGLKGEQIPLAARMFTISDTYDAMTRDRPYRAAMTSEQAAAEILRCRGTQFDPDCVDAFVEMMSDAESRGTTLSAVDQRTAPRFELPSANPVAAISSAKGAPAAGFSTYSPLRVSTM
jgi:putative nucleotidyltransferase with HDIG domain